MAQKKIISVVIPVYNEEKNLPLLYTTLCDIFQKLKQYHFELIFVDDGSRDQSWEVINSFAQTDDRIKAFSFSRNFGHQVALQAGYDNASGDAIISMDADMQHPPELIPALLQKWCDGSAIVYARKINRKDGFLKKRCASFFYRFINVICSTPIPRHVSDFRLIDKKVLVVLQACKERNPFWRGLVAWTGFSCSYVDCQYFERHAGQSGYTWKKMFQLAFDGITSFSRFPLHVAAYVGFISLFFAAVVGLYMVSATIFAGASYGLTAWLAEGLFFLVAGQFLGLWMLGEYVGRIAENQKDRPLYIVDKKVVGVQVEKKIVCEEIKSEVRV